MDSSALASAESWLSLIATAKLVAAFLVAIGVAIEFAGDWVSRPFEKIVSDAREQQMAELRKEASRLSAEAESARAAIADANARAAEAGQKAAEAQLALEKLKIARTLGPAQQESIIAAVRRFAGQRYRTAISQAADDGHAFWESLYSTLERAGWVYLPAQQPFTGVPPAGIPIAASPGV
jgi:hypothetical protein